MEHELPPQTCKQPSSACRKCVLDQGPVQVMDSETDEILGFIECGKLKLPLIGRMGKTANVYLSTMGEIPTTQQQKLIALTREIIENI